MIDTELEQFEAAANNIATIVASYYEQLIHEKVPEELAFTLTMGFQDYVWYEMFKKGPQ